MTKDHYTIKELEVLSNVKAATIRAWEKRFNLLNPDRTESNIRIYNIENLRRLLQIAFLVNSGYKISKIATFNGEEIDDECKKEMIKPGDSSPYILEFVFKIIEKDTDGFEKLYDHYLEKLLHDEFIIGVMEPLIEKIKKLWISRSIDPYYEEYILNRIFVKTIIAAEKERKPGRPAKEILIFQSDTTVFPVKLSLIYFLAAVKNYKIHYFFNQLSINSIRSMKGNFEPDIVYTEFNDTISDARLNEYCITLENTFPIAKNIISGKLMREFWKKIPNKVYYIRNLDTLNKSL